MTVIALDIGTSRTKAVLARWDGTIVAIRDAPTPVDAVPGVRHGFPPGAIGATALGLLAAVAALAADDPVDTIAVSCLGTAMAPLDAAGEPLGLALSPADPRPMAGPDLVARTGIERAELIERTGSDPRLASTLLHWCWWRDAEPGTFARIARFRSLRGLVTHALCGADAEDPSWASRTMGMDLATDAWSGRILDAAGIDAAILPPIAPSTNAWPIDPAVARRLGLPDTVRVVNGGMDNGCSFLGASDPAEARLVNIAGTYEHMAGVGPLPVVRAAAAASDGLVHRYVLPGEYLGYSRVPLGLFLGAIGTAAGEGGLATLLAALPEAPRGRAIALTEAAVRAALAAGRPPADVLLEVLEGCAAVLGRFTDGWTGAGGAAERIVAVGGGAAQGRSLQLKATMLGRPFSTLASDEGAALGVLRLAAIAIHGDSLAAACARFPVPVVRTWQPRPAA